MSGGRARAGAVRRLPVLEVAPVGLGLGALALGTAFGWDARLLATVASPPMVVRLALAGVSVIAAMGLLGAAVGRMEDRDAAGGHLAGMLRGIRLAFLALAAVAVAIGWALGSAMPFVVALVIAGVDVIETSFLLVVVRRSA